MAPRPICVSTMPGWTEVTRTPFSRSSAQRVGLGHRAPTRDAGRVHQHLEGVRQLGGHHDIGVGDVEHQDGRVREVGTHGVERVGVTAGEDHVMGPSEVERHGAADAAGRSGHESGGAGHHATLVAAASTPVATSTRTTVPRTTRYTTNGA